MNRSELREHLFRMLFRIEFHDESEYEEQMKLYTEALADPSEAELSYLLGKSSKVIEKVSELDQMIDEAVFGWKTDRMGRVELTIIRLALYEIKFDDDVPTGVAINEAVELAKRYGNTESASFVNGVLARLA
ncbi:MAG: transcription antitermination factor NusB [Clostridiales bacterium]|nr:transcription antitermination factor NusB [Clostridiales bacterium]MDY3745288.1 transcription antitermination factor NusB [Lachnospiraceae bacterium]